MEIMLPNNHKYEDLDYGKEIKTWVKLASGNTLRGESDDGGEVFLDCKVPTRSDFFFVFSFSEQSLHLK